MCLRYWGLPNRHQIISLRNVFFTRYLQEKNIFDNEQINDRCSPSAYSGFKLGLKSAIPPATQAFHPRGEGSRGKAAHSCI